MVPVSLIFTADEAMEILTTLKTADVLILDNSTLPKEFLWDIQQAFALL